MVKKVIWISSYIPRSCGVAYYSNHYITALKNYAKKANIDVSFKIIAHTDAKQADYPIISQGDKTWHHKVLAVIKKEKPDIVHIQHEYGLYETHNDKNRRVIELINMIKEEGIPVVMTYHSVYKRLAKPFAEFVDKSLKELNYIMKLYSNTRYPKGDNLTIDEAKDALVISNKFFDLLK